MSGRDADGGFTLIEILVSFTIFIIVATAATVGIVRAIDASHTGQQRVTAANLAQYYVTKTTVDTAVNRPLEGRTEFTSVGGGDGATTERFSVTRWIAFDDGDTCSIGTLFTVNVEVRQYETNTFLARSDGKVACPPA